MQLVEDNLSVSICHQLCSWHTGCSCHLIMSMYKALSDTCDASGRRQNTFVSYDWPWFLFLVQSLGVKLVHMNHIKLDTHILCFFFRIHTPIKSSKHCKYIIKTGISMLQYVISMLEMGSKSHSPKHKQGHLAWNNSHLVCT